MSLPGRILRRSPLLSPRGLLLRAAFMLLVFALLHLAGARDYTSIFSGTSPTGEPAGTGATLLAVVYAGSYLASVVLAPVMILAALVMWGLVRLTDHGGR
jgi:hypothetical protein